MNLFREFFRRLSGAQNKNTKSLYTVQNTGEAFGNAQGKNSQEKIAKQPRAIDLKVDANGVRSAGQQYVDLGLSVYWAAMNVGAHYNYECGIGCKWGEITQSDAEGDQTIMEGKMEKYVTDGHWGVPDYLTTLLPEDDMVHCQMGGDWRMPTVDEMDQLLTQCTWQAVLINRTIRAYRVTGPNGNTILLPQKDLWTSSLCEDNNKAFELLFMSGRPYVEPEWRDVACYVRGVLDKPTDR